jgi:hypothetical protein
MKYLKLEKKPLETKGVLKSEYRKGENEELEHTSNHRITKQIALDHLHEDKHYYTKLENMSKAAFEQGFLKAAIANDINPLVAISLLKYGMHNTMPSPNSIGQAGLPAGQKGPIAAPAPISAPATQPNISVTPPIQAPVTPPTAAPAPQILSSNLNTQLKPLETSMAQFANQTGSTNLKDMMLRASPEMKQKLQQMFAKMNGNASMTGDPNQLPSTVAGRPLEQTIQQSPIFRNR